MHTYPAVADDPPAVLHHLNRHFRYLWETSMFATGLYGVLDAGRATLRLSCAGHPPPLLVGAAGGVEPLCVNAVMSLLWDELGEVPCTEHAFRPGDRVVFYTDGITDRETQDGSMFDEEGLVASLGVMTRMPPAAIVERLVADLNAFARGQEPCDDQTLVVVGVD
jgi:sigma-B regulation protein RsbU (phosphoserine phosphatase)